MEVRLLNQQHPENFNDGLDSDLDTIGTILDSPVICGNCLIEMKLSQNQTYHCPNCSSTFKIRR